MSDVKLRMVRIAPDRLQTLSGALVECMNELQFTGGYALDEVLFATAYSLGIALAHRGAVLCPEQPLKRALPPLLIGYEAALKEREAREHKPTQG